MASETGRVEAFSDGVFAIAITLLILEVRVPEPEALGGGTLGAALAHVWPSYAAYLVSFLTIGVMWANHHAVFRHARRADHRVVMLNLLLLLCVSFIPFPTAVLASYLREPEALRTAALLFNATFLAMAVSFNLLWRAVYGQHDPGETGPAAEEVRAIHRRFNYGPLWYLGVLVLGLVAPGTSLAVNAALAVLYAFSYVSAPAAADEAG